MLVQSLKENIKAKGPENIPKAFAVSFKTDLF